MKEFQKTNTNDKKVLRSGGGQGGGPGKEKH